MLHRLHRSDGEIAVDVPHLGAHGRGQRGGRASAHDVGEGLRHPWIDFAGADHRVVHDLGGIFAEAQVSHAADNTDDGIPGRRVPRKLDAFAHRIFPRPEAIGDARAQDDVAEVRFVVAPLEETSRAERDPHRLEVPGRRGFIPEDRWQLVGPRRKVLQHVRGTRATRTEGNGAHRAHRLHAGQRRHAVEEILVEPRGLCRVGVLGVGQVEAEREHPVGVEARIGVANLPEAAHQETRSHQQHHGQCGLGDHQRVAGGVPRGPGRPPSRSLDRGHHAGPGVAEHRRAAEQHRGQRRHAEREEEDERVDAHRVETGQVVGREAQQRRHPHPRQRQPQPPAHSR